MWGAQPWKPPLHDPSSFQFGCSWSGGALGPEGHGGWDRKLLGPSAPACTPSEPRPSLKARDGNWSLHPWESGFPYRPSLPGPNAHSLHLPYGWLLRDVLLLTPGPQPTLPGWILTLTPALPSRLVHLAVIHEAPAVLLCCLALLPQEVLDIQNNLYQVGGKGRLCPDTHVCPGSILSSCTSDLRLLPQETICETLS